MKGKSSNRLRVLRAERELSQLDLSAKTGIQVTRYWYLETGRKPPTESERAKLAKALRVDESDLGFTQAREARAS
jgi:transcriptional regulator with XRE-family HTH domain